MHATDLDHFFLYFHSEYQKQIGKDTATQVALRGDVIKTSEAVTLIRQEKDRLQSEKQRIQSVSPLEIHDF